MICPECGTETEGTVNNRKERRCTACYAVLPTEDKSPAQPTTKLGPDTQEGAEADSEPTKPARGKKAGK